MNPLSPQSLSHGAAGIAMLHVERAAAGLEDWRTAHSWLSAAAEGDVDAGPGASLLHGAPALAFVLHAAARQDRYQRALAVLDTSVAALIRRRLDLAHARIDRGDRPALSEFDLFHGLTGLGAHLLRRDPQGALILDVLTYLIRLTEEGEDGFPGWWSHQPPTGRRRSDPEGGGHGNFGMAHGIGGPLVLLCLAMLRGVTVDGQTAAIRRVCDWLDFWRQDRKDPWWPEVITVQDLWLGRPRRSHPSRPSWCYGTPGIARALQLAGQALGDTRRQRQAERALISCLADDEQMALVIDHSICHGWAGLFQTAWRITTDAHTAEAADLRTRLHHLARRLQTSPSPGDGDGFLEGSTGVALTLHTAQIDFPPATGWDACLLIN